MSTDIRRVLIIGATSAIAREAARLYANSKDELFLVGRNEESVKEMAADLSVRGASRVGFEIIDLNHFEEHQAALEKATKFLHTVDVAIICHGSLPDQSLVEKDFDQALLEINTNGLSVISLLTRLADFFANQKKGTIAVITSVAGDRGRQSNYVYGSAKAMVSAYLQGMRGRLLPYGVHVVDIRPGFVDSPMTAHLQKGPLFSSPRRIAEIIVKSIERKRHTVYAPFYWRYILFVVRLIPEFLFKRIKI